jgi:hypothetical protein
MNGVCMDTYGACLASLEGPRVDLWNGRDAERGDPGTQIAVVEM